MPYKDKDKQNEFMRNYWKKNPAKYQEHLEKMREYRKCRKSLMNT